MSGIFQSILGDIGFQGAFFSTIIMIALGYVLYNKGILESRGKNTLTAIIWKLAVPCMAFDAFMTELDADQLRGQIFVLLLSFITYFALYFIGRLLFAKKGRDTARLAGLFCAIGAVTLFSMPILVSMYHDEGEAVLTISMMTLPFRVMVYIFAFFMISGLKFDRLSIGHTLKGVLINPIMIAMFLGIFIWLTQGFMPQIDIGGEAVSFLRFDKTLPALYKTVTSLKALVSPLSMLLIGISLADSDLISALGDKTAWGISLLRTLFAPLVTVLFILLFQLSGIARFSDDAVISMVIGFSAPASATVSLYAIQYNRGAMLASRVCLISTLLCVITIPAAFIAAKLLCLFPAF